MSETPSGSVRVSVIVPVYNTGEHIEQLIDSLAAQTLPQDEFETIFVDDGSTDHTPARLDRLARKRKNVVVLHEPNSGWPGRPRNVGIDHARGTYVFFVDHDDWLGTEALERMTALADAESADILVPRYAGHRRGVAKSLFTKPRPGATLANAPLMDSLTPHKMFRTAFVKRHHLRFPEGRRRLEDHVFVTEAYFLAEHISVLTDYHCYFHIGRGDAGNAGFQRVDPTGYYGNVREVIALVLKYTEPGSIRDRYLRRTLRIELLSRLDGESFLKQDAAYQRALLAEARQVALESVPLSADAGLPPPQKVRAFLLREDRLDDLISYAKHDVQLQAKARLVDLGWDDDGRLRIEVTASLRNRGSGTPWTYETDGEAVRLSTPPGVHGDIPLNTVDCTSLLTKGQVQIVLRRREDSEEWPLDTESSLEVHDAATAPWISYRASVHADLLTVGGGRPLTPGTWDVFVWIRQTGWTKKARLGADRTDQASAGARPADVADGVVLPYWTDRFGNLSLAVNTSVGFLERLRALAVRIIRRARLVLRFAR